MISVILFTLGLCFSTIILLSLLLKDYKGSNIKCGGDMIINGRHIPKRKDLDVQDICVRNGKFIITY